MSKRFFSLILLLFLLATLTGCGSVIDLTEDETRLIAEYAAELLLKYDVNYTDRLDEGDKAAAEMELEDSSTEMESSEEMSSQEIVATETSEEKGQNVDSRIGAEETSGEQDASVGTESDIAKIAGLEGVSITYKDYLITDQYPATDEDGEFIYLEASEGYQLLVIRFGVADIMEQSQEISLIDKELDYRIVCNGDKAANPMLTILMNDLGTLETTVKPGEEQEAVLIFQISDDMKDKLQTMELKVQYNGTENVITIL
ncbi:MAG: hypothetical protein ACI4A3_08940 [Lachnospiraceae bacterium]